MILVDSSVWIAAFSKRPPFRIEDLVDVNEVVTCLPILQEVLQGVDDDYRFEDTRDILYDLRAIDDPMTGELFHEAILLFRDARKKGVGPLIARLPYRCLRDSSRRNASSSRSRLRSSGESYFAEKPPRLTQDPRVRRRDQAWWPSLGQPAPPAVPAGGMNSLTGSVRQCYRFTPFRREGVWLSLNDVRR